MKILSRLCKNWNDKKLADKCGLSVQEICTHEPDFDLKETARIFGVHECMIEHWLKCVKCGEFYK